MTYREAARRVRREGCVSMNLPLLIRVMEWAREEAKDDVALHKAAERMVREWDGRPLRMEDYGAIFGRGGGDD